MIFFSVADFLPRPLHPPRTVQISRRRGRETTYTACFCRQATVLAFSSLPLATIWSFYLHLAGVPKIQSACGRDSPRRGGVTQTGGITDFIGATAGTICKGSYNFEIFGNNCLSCYEMSSDLIV